MKHFYSVGNYSPGGEAFKEHSGEFEEAYLGDIDDEVSDWLQHRYDRTVTIHTTREFFLGSILSHFSNPLGLSANRETETTRQPTNHKRPFIFQNRELFFRAVVAISSYCAYCG